MQRLQRGYSVALVAGLLALAALLGVIPTITPVSAHECPAPGPSPENPKITCVFQGRMTGGGRFDVTSNFAPSPEVTPTLLTHGFEVHCDVTDRPNNIEVNWKDSAGVEHRFHMNDMVSAHCEWNPALGSPNPPSADFNTWVGSGTGKFDGTAGASIYAIFTDQGQPAAGKDPSTIVIYSADGTLVLNWSGFLLAGAQQAHNSKS